MNCLHNTIQTSHHSIWILLTLCHSYSDHSSTHLPMHPIKPNPLPPCSDPIPSRQEGQYMVINPNKHHKLNEFPKDILKCTHPADFYFILKKKKRKKLLYNRLPEDFWPLTASYSVIKPCANTRYESPKQNVTTMLSSNPIATITPQPNPDFSYHDLL